MTQENYCIKRSMTTLRVIVSIHDLWPCDLDLNTYGLQNLINTQNMMCSRCKFGQYRMPTEIWLLINRCQAQPPLQIIHQTLLATCKDSIVPQLVFFVFHGYHMWSRKTLILLEMHLVSPITVIKFMDCSFLCVAVFTLLLLFEFVTWCMCRYFLLFSFSTNLITTWTVNTLWNTFKDYIGQDPLKLVNVVSV